MADGTTVKFNKLNGSNYQVWKFRMEMLLIKEDIWSVISTAAPSPVTDVWTTKDQRARATIGLLVEDNQLIHIRSQTTAAGVWKALKDYHEKSTLCTKVFLLKRLCRSQLSESGNMEEHLDAMLDVVNRLSGLGEDLKENLVVALLLCSLPESYETLIMALETRPDADLTLELVKGKLVDEYRRRQETSGKSVCFDDKQTALKISERNKSKGRKKPKCFECGKVGHVKKDCWLLAKKLKEGASGKEQSQANVVKQEPKSNDSQASGYTIFQLSTKPHGNAWFIDSGATCHMTNDRSFFVKMDSDYRDKVFMADGATLEVVGKGSGNLRCLVENSVSVAVFQDVLYVPNLKGSLVSVRKLVMNGLQVKFSNEECTITKIDGHVVATASPTGELYKLNLKNDAMFAKQDDLKGCIHNWHRRMGHRDPVAIKSLVNKNLATGIKISDCGQMTTCENCMEGKMARLPFPISTTRSKKVLDLIHTDLCGPMQTATPSGKKYILTLIDDFSRFCIVALLKNKSEVADHIRDFVRLCETKYKQKPRKFRSDRGGEYINKDIQVFLRKEGIEWEVTAPYTPQQNGVAERKNRTLTEMARTMLSDGNLHNQYWGEAVRTACYLQNRLPSRSLEKTPFEHWYGTTPDLRHIRQFGCHCFVHIPDEKRRKLDFKAVKLIFIGYEEGSKAYRLLDVTTNLVTVSRDVKFLERDCSFKHSEHLNNSEESFVQLEGTKQDLDTVTDQDGDGNVNKENTHTQQRRISSRPNKGVPPERLIQVMNVKHNVSRPEDPCNIEEAFSSPQSVEWQKAMTEELHSLEEMQTWSLTELPKNKQAIGCKWVFKTKLDAMGNVVKYRARLVAQGFSQKYGTDYDEVFAPVGKLATFRTLLTLASYKKLKVHHFDIKTAFLNGKLNEEIYMKQPPGFISTETAKLVCKLHRSIYGLKQSARVWNEHLNTVLEDEGFQRGKADTCLYSKKVGDKWYYIFVYVDDLIVVGDANFVGYVYEILSKHFTVSNLGELKLYLGIEVERDGDGIYSIHQSSYISRILERFQMENAKPDKTPMDTGYLKNELQREETEMPEKDRYRQAIGCLLYVATCTRPDIAVSVSISSRKITNPSLADWTAVKRIMRYLKGTLDYKLKLGNTEGRTNVVFGYADADYAGDQTDRKSNSGFVFQWLGATITWASRKQNNVALSSTEAEYVALAEACREALWIRNLMEDLKQRDFSTTIYEDNQSCLKMVENEGVTQRTKHIATRFHFVKDLRFVFNFVYCATEEMIADLLTKPLDRVKTKKFVSLLGFNFVS